MTMQLAHGEYWIDDALDRFDFATCHAWLSSSYWSPGISRVEVEHGFKNSTLVLGAYSENAQVGCLRVVSDRTRFAYFMDVFVDERHRGRGLGRALVKSAVEHPDLRLVYKWTLATADAHGVYREVGFSSLPEPERWMYLERPRPWLTQ